MNYYFENYVDSGALFAFLDKLGLVATQASDSVGYTILNAFGLIVSSPEKAYEVGFGVFNMLGAVVQSSALSSCPVSWPTVSERNRYLSFVWL